MKAVSKIHPVGGWVLLGDGNGQCGLPSRGFQENSTISPSWRKRSPEWRASLEVKDVGVAQRHSLQLPSSLPSALPSLPSSFVRGKHLSELSTWGIGGPAKLFVEVHDESQLAAALRFVCGSHLQFNEIFMFVRH
jgi:hypothetical protein